MAVEAATPTPVPIWIRVLLSRPEPVVVSPGARPGPGVAAGVLEGVAAGWGARRDNDRLLCHG